MDLMSRVISIQFALNCELCALSLVPWGLTSLYISYFKNPSSLRLGPGFYSNTASVSTVLLASFPLTTVSVWHRGGQDALSQSLFFLPSPSFSFPWLLFWDPLYSRYIYNRVLCFHHYCCLILRIVCSRVSPVVFKKAPGPDHIQFHFLVVKPEL